MIRTKKGREPEKSEDLTKIFKQRKSRSKKAKPHNLVQVKVEDEAETVKENHTKDGKGFFACYLLTSLSPRFKGHTYIGFTVNPRRRIRQHNGEIGSGAWSTKRRRPWEMVLCIYGFPTNVSALQFEWAWQHPKESNAVRQAAAAFKSFSGITNKIKLAYTMLTLPVWQSLDITVNYFSTKYMGHSAGCPSLPEHMRIQVCSMDELPCYTGRDDHQFEYEDDYDNLDAHEAASETDIAAKENFMDPNCNALASYSHHSGNSSGEQTERFVDYETRRPREASMPDVLQVDHGEPFSCWDSSRMAFSIVTNSYSGSSSEEIEGHKECEVRKPREKSILEVERADTFDLVDSPVRTALPVAATLSVGEKVGDADTVELVGMKQFNATEVINKNRLLQSAGRTLLAAEATVGKNSHSSIVAHEVEIIDLLTPPSGCRIKSNNKKRGAPPPYPLEIIDLT